MVLRLQFLIERQLLGNAFDEVGYHPVVLILPRLRVPPMTVEVLLHLAHLLRNSLFGILLHLGVDGGIDSQATAIQVVPVFGTPVIKIIGHCFTEVLGLTIVVRLNTVLQLDVQFLQGVTFLLTQFAVSC